MEDLNGLPQLPQLYDSVKLNNVYLFLEWIPGGDLIAHVPKFVGSHEKCRMALRQILEAVGGMHKLQYAHCDIKKENFMLMPDDKIRIIDLGFCSNRFADRHGGTVSYMAPERIACCFKKQTFDAYAADVYSNVVCIVLRQLLPS